MKKSPSLLKSLALIPTLAVAFLAAACSSGEMPSTNANTGGSSASTGGNNGNGSGGSTSFGTGGSTSFGTGGSTSSGSGGSSSSSSGGATGFGTGGATGFGTGGASSSGTGGTSSGTGTGGSTTSGGALTVVDGYATGGTWMGYAYTFTGPATGSKATVTPASYKGLTQLCLDGSIAADSTYGSVAGMGWNINQALGTTSASPPINTVATSGTGLLVNVGSVTGLTVAMGSGSQLRAQIKAAAGDFCAPIAMSGSFMIPWSSFNSKCWDTTLTGATAFTAGTAITAVELVIPSAATAIGPFHLCLLDAHSY